MSPNKFPSKKHLKNSYSKTYRMQAVGDDGNTIRTSVPRDVVKREADRQGLPIEQFIKDFCVVWLYNGFPGAWAIFRRKKKKDGTNTQQRED